MVLNFLTKFEARGASKGGAYNKSMYTVSQKIFPSLPRKGGIFEYAVG